MTLALKKYVGNNFRSEYVKQNSDSTPPAVQHLIDKLSNQTDQTIVAAVNALGNLGNIAAPAVPSLMMLYLGQSIFMRNTVARTLAKIGQPAVEALLPCLSDPRADVRMQTARVLGWIGPDAMDANAELMRRLGDPNQAVRQAILNALDCINE